MRLSKEEIRIAAMVALRDNKANLTGDQLNDIDCGYIGKLVPDGGICYVCSSTVSIVSFADHIKDHIKKYIAFS